MEFDIYNFMISSKPYNTFFIVLLGFCPYFLLAQQAHIDSLKSVVKERDLDSIKVETLAKIGDAYYEENFDSTTYYYQKAFDLSEKIPYYDIQLSALRSLGYVYSFRKNDFDSSLVFFHQALRLSEAESDSLAVAYVLSDIGRIYWKKGNSIEALAYHLQVRALGEKLNHPKILLRSNQSLGIIENEEGNNDKAKQYYKVAYAIADSLKRNRSKGLILNNLGKAFQDEKEFDIAYDHFQKADSIFTKLGDRGRLSLVNYNLGKNYFLSGKTQKGIEYYNIALDFNKKIRNQEREVMILSGLAKAYQESNQLRQSIFTAENALKKLKQIDTELYYDEIYKTLGDSYELIGDYSNSVLYYKRYLDFTKKRNETEKTKKVASLKHNYVLEKKENKILELKNIDLEKEKNLIKSKANLQKLGIAFLAFLVLSIIIFYRTKIKELQKFNHLRNNLSKNLHDNIGTSLNHIKLLSKRMNRKTSSQGEMQTTINKIKNISNELMYNMHDMVWSLDKEKESVGSLLERIQDYADNVFADFNIPYQFKIGELNKKTILSTQKKINTYLIFKESINNIIKHTKAEKVIISFKKENSNLFSMSISSFYFEKKEVETLSNHKGISNMRKRAEEIGGEIHVIDNDKNFIIEFSL